MMEADKLPSGKKEKIVRRCFERTIDVYPPETAAFLKNEQDRFLNPVGYTILHEIANILDEAAGFMDMKKLTDSLENIIKIRVAQEASLHEAISFVFYLREAITEELTSKDKVYQKKDNHGEIVAQLHQIDQNIEKIASLASFIYMQCRDKIDTIKLQEKTRQAMK